MLKGTFELLTFGEFRTSRQSKLLIVDLGCFLSTSQKESALRKENSLKLMLEKLYLSHLHVLKPSYLYLWIWDCQNGPMHEEKCFPVVSPLKSH